MEIVRIILTVIYFIIALVVIILALIQTKDDSGLSQTITGSSTNNFYEKNKGRTKEGKQKRLMITGFLQMEQGENGQKNIWDYSGCLYPEGMLTSEANYVFNHSQIEEVHFIGLVDEEEEEFKKKLKEAIEKLENL